LESNDHFWEIYTSHAAEYHRLIAREDVEGQLLKTLRQVADLQGKRVLDLGSGTGRIPLLLHPYAGQIIASDLSQSMLRQQSVVREQIGGAWPLVFADMRASPSPAESFDVITAGWAIGHLTGWHPSEWRAQVDRVLVGMHRLVKQSGVLIVIETLGTGVAEPAPPTPELAAYYADLESIWGFTRRVIRTDYRFEDLSSAAEMAGFFFGPELRARIESKRWTRLPEFTGVWSKRLR